MPHKDRLGLVVWLIVAGLFVTFVHDYAYRRVGGDDFEMGGLVSHAGSDMLVVTIALTVTAWLWLTGKARR